MKTWENYKEHVRNTDSLAAKDLDSAIAQATNISAAFENTTVNSSLAINIENMPHNSNK